MYRPQKAILSKVSRASRRKQVAVEEPAPRTTPRRMRPEVASMNMGSMNFGLFPMLQRFKGFRHDWERLYLEGMGWIIEALIRRLPAN